MSSSTKIKKKYINDENTIYFKSNKANGFSFLSNFWPYVDPKQKSSVDERTRNSKCSFEIDGIIYKSVEHFFQSKKYESILPEAAKDIREQSTALAAKKRNTFYKHKKPIDVAEWTRIGPEIMLSALRAKFKQNMELARSLLMTDDKKLIEVPGRSKDRWAGEDGLLGRLLMQVREEIRNEGVVTIDDLKQAEIEAEQKRLAEIERKKAERAKKKRSLEE